jgi:hypothetical protein
MQYLILLYPFRIFNPGLFDLFNKEMIKKKEMGVDAKNLIFSIYSFKFYEGSGIEKILNRYNDHLAEMLPASISGHVQYPRTHGIRNRHATGNNNA